MRTGPLCLVLCASWLGQAAFSSAQSAPLTLADVFARARERAPQVVSARLAIDEARGRLVGASLRLQQNPEVDTNVGNRQAAFVRFTDFDVAVSQTLEPGSRRDARLAGANAGLAGRTADLAETTRLVLRAAAEAYYRALQAKERIRLLASAEDVASNVAAAAGRRFKAGDIAVLDVNVAQAALARVRAERRAAEAARIVALSELQEVLGVGDEIDVTGAFTLAPEPDLRDMETAAAQRPELAALEASLREAEADQRLAGTLSKPDVGLGVRFSRESGDHIVLGGLKVTLPVFAHGQELRAVGAARAARLRLELDAAHTRIGLEVRAAFAAYRERTAAVRALEAEAIPGLDENEALATRSFDVGQIGLLELLLIRREVFETRAQYLDTLLEAALARVELDASAALLR